MFNVYCKVSVGGRSLTFLQNLADGYPTPAIRQDVIKMRELSQGLHNVQMKYWEMKCVDYLNLTVRERSSCANNICHVCDNTKSHECGRVATFELSFWPKTKIF